MSEFKQKKPARNADEHLERLKARKLFITEDEELFIKSKIRAIGYYRLSGYFGPLQSSKDVFKENVTFSDILRLYEFDKKLRQLTSQVLKCIEIEVKARTSDIMSLAYESDWYLNKALFMTDKTKPAIISEFSCENGSVVEVKTRKEISIYNTIISNIQNSIDRNNEMEYIKKFKQDYGEGSHVPSWMMMECISFGDLSRLFSVIRCAEKKHISSHFGAVSPEFLMSWMHSFLVLRNACAHHARIWNKKISKDLMFPNKPSAIFYTKENGENDNWRKYYGISTCFLRVLKEINPEMKDNFIHRFNRLTTIYDIDKNAMGFPEKLDARDIWNIP